ncbi:MAG TPA: gluconate 2-dehydrogenase subunit 3 family protein [Actinomycetota bacterium]|nr:gluconate 2-dehydrogenase subunit 3 family protein [Actinomycetota bacterium]
MFTRPQLGPERFFADGERRAIDALFDAILPGRPDSPGARDANAGEYLSALLAHEDVYFEVPRWRELYRTALPALDLAAASRFGGRSIAALSVNEVTELLRDLAAGTVAGLPEDMDQKRLFTTIRAHCIEGCFADPRWGGNRGGLMWEWLGCLAPPEEFNRNGNEGAA